MDFQTIERSALGRIGQIGDVYDVRTDQFCGFPVFKKKLPDEAIQILDSPFSDICLVHSDNFSEKSSKLEVTAELQVSLLAGLVKVEGSGKYLNDPKKSARIAKSSFVYNIVTKEETLNLFHENIKHCYSLDALQSGVGTHIVTGISWGANSVLSCFYENEDSKKLQEIKGHLSGALKKLGAVIKNEGKAGMEMNTLETITTETFEVRIYGDILPQNEELPTCFNESLELMKKIPRFLQNANQGKGKPLTYRLVPISLVQHYLKTPIQTMITLKSLEEAILFQAVKLCDQMSRTGQLIYDLHENAVKFNFCLEEKEICQISALSSKIEIQAVEFKAKLSHVLTDVRSGTTNVSDLSNLIKESQCSRRVHQKAASIKGTFATLINKINFAKTMTKRGVNYIGHGKSLHDELLQNCKKESYVLLFTENRESTTTDADRWKKNMELYFSKLNNETGNCQFYAVDCSIHKKLPKMPDGINSCIQISVERRWITTDLLEDRLKLAGKPWARTTSKPERVLYFPNKRVHLTLHCAGSHCDRYMSYTWKCVNCCQVFEFGFDDYIYCLCGKVADSALEFKCPDPNHGLSFEKYTDRNYLQQLLKQLRPFKEVNILILGETGVGKSTWINGFVNYMAHKNLQEAELGDLLTLIPSEFTVCNPTPEGVFDQITVRTGRDENEVFTVGHSSTQTTKVYPFPIGDTLFRLIDTPGIGDTRGIDQDKKNFQNILSTLAHHNEIHGICILLKPNNAKLTVMFRFCIKELLTYLHRDASKNIVFCFTNSRSTLYKPGDTFPALNALLKENKEVEIVVSPHTVYCFDSEAYRYLAAVKNNPPVHFEENDKDIFAKSWEKSVSETRRLLEHVVASEPHQIKSTLNLNHAREMVLKLTRPLAEISRNIQTNKASLFEELKDIEKTEENIEKLKMKKYTTITEIETRKIEHPKTVCAHSKCVKVRKSNNVMINEYTTVCHAHCYLTGIQRDVLGDPGLMSCAAFGLTRGDDCSKCNHSYKNHLHIYYDSVQKPKQVEDQAVIEALKTNSSGSQMKKNMMLARKMKIKKFEIEHKQIQKASAKFAYFLKRNAITPYNDALEQYLVHLIGEEEDKQAQGGNPQALRCLKMSMASYLEEKSILETQMSKGREFGEVIDAQEIEKLVENLKKLELNGNSLKEALDCLEKTQLAVYQEEAHCVYFHDNQNIKNNITIWDLVPFCRPLMFQVPYMHLL